MINYTIKKGKKGGEKMKVFFPYKEGMGGVAVFVDEARMIATHEKQVDGSMTTLTGTLADLAELERLFDSRKLALACCSAAVIKMCERVVVPDRGIMEKYRFPSVE